MVPHAEKHLAAPICFGLRMGGSRRHHHAGDGAVGTPVAVIPHEEDALHRLVAKHAPWASIKRCAMDAAFGVNRSAVDSSKT